MIESFLLAIVLAAFAGFIAWRNNRLSRFANAGADFRAAFSDAFLRLTASNDATYSIVLNSYDQHLRAITTFQPYVVWYLMGSFKSAAKEYSLQANIQLVKPPITALLADGLPWAQAQRADLLASVEHLLKYATDA